MKRYEKFDFQDMTKKGHNYLTTMVDSKYDYLPYWLVNISSVPAFAQHVRVDDAELVASWYEAIVCTQYILGEDDKAGKVEQGLKKHLLDYWGNEGLRYHGEDFPWTKTIHSSLHEMGYILSALNRLLEKEPDNHEAAKRASELVRGMRKLVLHRKKKIFWSGDYDFEEKVYEFPGDVYLKDGGWNSECVTGRGEESIRNSVVLHALVIRAELFHDEVALDLAEGIANHLLGPARYFNWKGEFFGHVHSTLWFAAGLARLGRIMSKDNYINKANEIFLYVKSISSEFGWVPEYAQWHPMNEEHCETCCIRDMILCAFELMDAEPTYDYWDLINKFTRNQLSEQQIKDGSFIALDNTIKDTEDMTWENMDKRIVGGWSGGGEPNSLSLARFRSIAGCCVGTAPQALYDVWERIIEEKNGAIYVNLPIEKNSPLGNIEIGYPNEGYMKITAGKAGQYRLRHHPWMGERFNVSVNGTSQHITYANDGTIQVRNVNTGDIIELSHILKAEDKHETVRGIDFCISWHGPDVTNIDPPGLALRLYQREEGIEKEYPKVGGNKEMLEIKPTQQKK